ncbi:MAG: hypothetical protein MK105_13190 [Crocinitomicaceae bacterium]|nr:hypothetical protein [Crocinitomicaceae bacterium]
MRFGVIIICVLFGLISCKKDEIPIPKHEAGEGQVSQIPMGEDYANQLFYDLETNSVISTNDKTDWDLGFESNDDGWHVVLNTSKGMGVHRSDLAFDQITSDVGLDWHWDKQTGNLDSTAIGDWTNVDKTYVIDLGYNSAGTHLGFKKLMINDYTASTFTIEVGDLTSVIAQEMIVTKDDNTSFTYFSFNDGVVDIAPSKDSWDLMFTQYTHLFNDPATIYVVTGVLLNRFETQAALIEDKSFELVDYNDAVSANYSSNLNYIGYNWKTYDYDNAVYIVDPNKIYIVKTFAGIYYKMHFIDFYNDSGIKGYPTFEVVQL